MQTSSARLCILVVLVSSLLLSSTQAQQNGEEKLDGLANALKYLQELDRYYSQVARPSPRSGAASHVARVEHAVRMLQLQEYDRLYAHRNRPRFGKRTGGDRRTAPDYSVSEDEDLWRRRR